MKVGFTRFVFLYLNIVHTYTVNQVCFHEWKPVDKKNTAVNSLVFHTR